MKMLAVENRDKKLISKRRVAELFGVSMHTIDCWLHDGKLPEPKKTFPGRNGIITNWSLVTGLNSDSIAE
jgi:predicted DNA-binding transcriptional regulator AlpA